MLCKPLSYNFVPSRCSAMESKHLKGFFFGRHKPVKSAIKNTLCHIVSHVNVQKLFKRHVKRHFRLSQTFLLSVSTYFSLFQPVSACFSLFQPSSEVGAHHMARPSRFQVAGADPVDCGKKDKASGHAEHLKPGFTLSKP